MAQVITREQAESGICPNCGSDFVDSDRTVEPQQAWNCFDCGAVWWKSIKSQQGRRNKNERA